MICPSRVALHGMAHSFIELCKALHQDKAVIYEASILWPPDVESQLIGKDPDAGKDWKQKKKGAVEDELVR